MTAGETKGTELDDAWFYGSAERQMDAKIQVAGEDDALRCLSKGHDVDIWGTAWAKL